MARFTKKPVTIEAVQWTKELIENEGNITQAYPGWLLDALGTKVIDYIDGRWYVKTLESSGDVFMGLEISWDDWIIQGVQGELYPCKPDIFEATYETELT